MTRRKHFLGRIISALVIAVIGLPVLAAPVAQAAAPTCIADTATPGEHRQYEVMTPEEDPSDSGWVNGNVGPGGDFVEGGYVRQMYEIEDLTPGQHTVVVQYRLKQKDGGDPANFGYDFVDDIKFIGSGGTTVDSVHFQTVQNTLIDGPSYDISDPALRAALLAWNGNLDINMTVTYDVPVGVDTAYLRFDTHIASELFWGAATGAGDINGSPYHTSWERVGCKDAPSVDRQLQVETTFGGFLTVVKDTQPNDAQDFHFGISPAPVGGAANDFILDDDANATYSNSATFFVAPGQYTVSELLNQLPANSPWYLDDITCTGSTTTPTDSGMNGKTVTVPTRKVSSTGVVCTFVNKRSQPPTGSVDATPQFDRDYNWSIDKRLTDANQGTKYYPAGGTSPTFDYSVDVTKIERPDSNYRVSGTFSIANGNPVDMTGVTPSVTAGSGTCSATRTGTFSDPATTIAAATTTATQATYSYSCTGMTSASGQVSVTTSYTVGSLTSTNQSIGTANYAFTTPTTVTDDSITVSDNRVDLNGAAAGTSVTVSSSQTLTYSWTPDSANQAAGTCADYRNTASYATSNPGNTAANSNEPNDTGSDAQDVTVCKGADLTVDKGADPKLTRTYLWDITKTVDDNEKQVDANGDATFNYTVTVTPGSYTDSGWQMRGSITVTNPNPWAVTLTGVTDTPTIAGLALASPCSVDTSSGLTVPARAGTTNGSKTYTYTCLFTEDGDSTTKVDYNATTNKNVATASWNAATAHTPTGTDSGEVTVTQAMWEDRTDDDWKMTEVNRYADVVDSKYLGGVLENDLDWIAVMLTVDRKKVYTYPLTIEDVAVGTCEELVNTARVTAADDRETNLDEPASQTVKACNAGAPGVDKSLTTSFDRTHKWEIDKAVVGDDKKTTTDDSASFDYEIKLKADETDSNFTATGSVTVSNPNDFRTMTVDISESLAACTFTDPDGTDTGVVITDGVARTTLAKKGTTGDSVTLDIDCDFGDTRPADDLENKVTATEVDGSLSNDDTVAVDFGDDPAYETRATVEVTDDQTDDLDPTAEGKQEPITVTWSDYEAADKADGWMTVASYSLTWPTVKTACTKYDNTASVWETRMLEEYSLARFDYEEPVARAPLASDKVTVEVCTPGALTGTNAPVFTVDRNYNWDIAKSNGQPDTEIPAGATETVNYAITVRELAYVDDHWQLGGTVSATNPNTFGTTVVDYAVTTAFAGATCAVTNGDDVTLPNASGSSTTPVSRDYTCTLGSTPTANSFGVYTGSTTFTATPADGEAAVLTVTSPFAVQMAEVDKTIRVTDSRNGGEPVELDVITWGDEGGPVHTYRYSVPVTPPPGECETERNTASYAGIVPVSIAAVLTQQHPAETGSSSTSTTICALAPLELGGSAAGDYDRQYAWDIAKAADQTEFAGLNGTTDTVTYTVTVTQGGFADSGWALEGAVSVANPNGFRSIAVDSVDVAGAGAVCSVDVAGGLSVAADDSASYPFECTWAEQPAYDGSLLATVVAEGVTDTVSIAAPLTLDEEFDRTVTVTDPMFGADPLGELTWTEAGVVTDLTYTYDVTMPTTTCETIDNTATIVETEQSATESIQVCGTPPPLPPNPPQPPPRPPVVIPPVVVPPQTPLPNTGAPAGIAGLTWAGGLLVALGIALALSTRTTRRRRLG